MNVFEDLIEELKGENLLEQTITDLKRNGSGAMRPDFELGDTADFSFGSDLDNPDELAGHALSEATAPVDAREFYRKRAMEEVSSLQMVEHVLSGVEREHMKIAPVAYDDLEVKKALHKFLQVSEDLQSEQHVESEYQLMMETEKWCSALSARDSNISVANIRRFCENSRPVLSSQALMALSRFYRNSPYSEPVRGKFDFVITKLFSRDLEDGERRLLFGHSEMIGHLKTLYANWSSISLFNSEGDNRALGELASKFDDFVEEAEASATFGDLIANDFFNRVRLCKENANEMFFAADVTASAIACNVRIGNKFVELLRAEKELSGIEKIEEKYGYNYDTIVSNAASKTLQLVELLKDEEQVLEDEHEIMETQAPAPIKWRVEPDQRTKKQSRRPSFELFGVNKWLLAATIIVAVISGGMYLWSDRIAGEESSAIVANNVDLAGSPVTEHISVARAGEETLYGVTLPSWDSLNEAQKKEFLGKAYQFAAGKGFKKVNLLNSKGRSVGYASKDRMEVFAE